MKWFACLACLLPISMIDAQTIIDDDFDAAEVSDWIGTGNTRTFSEHNITQAESVITSEVIATQSNTNRSITSETSFEPSAAGGFSITFVVDNIGGQPGANGYFMGIVRDNDLFFRDATTKNFGLAFFGQDPRTGSVGGFGLIYGDNNGSAPSDFLLANSDEQGDVDINSFSDGFTATIHVDPTGWSYEITGLSDAAASEKVFTDNGTWEEAGTDFATLFPESDTWFAIASLQVVAATTYTHSYDRITLVGGSNAGGGSGLQILSIEIDDQEVDPSATISWTSGANETYSLDYSTDLINWPEVEDSILSGGNTSEFALHFLPNYPELVGAPRVFFRIRKN